MPEGLADRIAQMRSGETVIEANASVEVAPVNPAKANQQENRQEATAPAADTPAVAAGTEAPAATAQPADARAQAAEIAALCAANNMSSLAAGFISAGTPLDQIQARVADAKEIRARVSAITARYPSADAAFAESLIAQGLTPDQASAQILTKISSGQSVEITSAVKAGAEQRATPLIDSRRIYGAMNNVSGKKE